VRKYFIVSTDKAANPINMMGASKKIMELFLMNKSNKINISTARFANVAFSDGSLLHGLNMRLMKNQAIAAPKDIKRYFISPQESGELCLLSCILGKNREIFFPKPIQDLKPVLFTDIVESFLSEYGYELFHCQSEQEARQRANDLISQKKWPCYFHDSDTTGEKSIEEFYTEDETLNFERFINIGIILNTEGCGNNKKKYFLNEINKIKNKDKWSKREIISLFKEMLPDFNHQEKEKFLDERM
jgi:FlaA1/EpsC-like NDP-sugar epimerase